MNYICGHTCVFLFFKHVWIYLLYICMDILSSYLLYMRTYLHLLHVDIPATFYYMWITCLLFINVGIPMSYIFLLLICSTIELTYVSFWYNKFVCIRNTLHSFINYSHNHSFINHCTYRSVF